MSISSLLSSQIVCSWSWNYLMLPIPQECLLFHFAGQGRSILWPFLVNLVLSSNFRIKVPHHNCVISVVFQDRINGVVEEKLSVSSSEWEVVGAYTWTIFSWYLSVMRRTSSATLEFPEDTLVMLSFHFLFTRKPTPACPLFASEWYSRWLLGRVVKLSSFLRSSPSQITSHFMLFCFSSSSSSFTCKSFSTVPTL